MLPKKWVKLSVGVALTGCVAEANPNGTHEAAANEGVSQTQLKLRAGEAADLSVSASQPLSKQVAVAQGKLPAGAVLEPAIAVSGWRSWIANEANAKFLAAAALRSLCVAVGDCDRWLRTAAASTERGTWTLSDTTEQALAIAAERFGAAAGSSLETPRAVATGVRAGALPPPLGRAEALRSLVRNAQINLASASYFGLSRAMLGDVYDQLLGTVDPEVGGEPLEAQTIRIQAPPASGLHESAPLYLENLKASVLNQARDPFALDRAAGGFDVPAGVLGAPAPLSGSVVGTVRKDQTLGGTIRGSGATPLDSALDTSCDNVYPGKYSCLSETFEWAIGSEQHDVYGLPFAVAERRCEPCDDGDEGAGTLRVMTNGFGSVVRCDTTTDACDPSGGNATVAGCDCLR